VSPRQIEWRGLLVAEGWPEEFSGRAPGSMLRPSAGRSAGRSTACNWALALSGSPEWGQSCERRNDDPALRPQVQEAMSPGVG